VVGYQNGGDTATACTAANGTMLLPKTRIKVLIPKLCYERGKVKGKRGGPLKVDIEVSPLDHGPAVFISAIHDAAVDHVLSKQK